MITKEKLIEFCHKKIQECGFDIAGCEEPNLMAAQVCEDGSCDEFGYDAIKHLDVRKICTEVAAKYSF